MSRSFSFALVVTYMMLVVLVFPKKAFGFGFVDENFLSLQGWEQYSDGQTLSITDGILHLESSPGANEYPFLEKSFDIFSSDQYEVNIKFRYLNNQANQGAGLVISDTYISNGTVVASIVDRAIGIWDGGALGYIIGTNLCRDFDNSLCSGPIGFFPKTFNPSVFHLLTISRNTDIYEIYLDETLIFTSAPTEIQFEYIRIGNPETTNPIMFWPVFEVDYITISDLGTISGFDLPVDYEGRSEGNDEAFRTVVNERVTSYFDHQYSRNNFISYMGGEGVPLNECYRSGLSENCYDGHNGIDFSSRAGESVLSVAEGEVVFASAQTDDGCEPVKGGYGCSVIVDYGDGVYGLYAHLKEVLVNEFDEVDRDSLIGLMGNTGCPNCGRHLHFGILKAQNNPLTLGLRKLGRSDWKNLLEQMQLDQMQAFSGKSYCSYYAPNGEVFSFSDPFGWAGDGEDDPWEKPRSEGGCDTESHNLWRFEI